MHLGTDARRDFSITRESEARMLVLGRRCDEAVIIELEDGRKIRLLIVRVADKVVRLGFDAPRSVNIYREELGSREGVSDGE
jgi:carbon storage regulator CsrA